MEFARREISAAFPSNWQIRLVWLLWKCMFRKRIHCEYNPACVSFFHLNQHRNKYVRLPSLRGTACSTIIFALTAVKHAKPSDSCAINQVRSGNARRFWTNKDSLRLLRIPDWPKWHAIFTQTNPIMHHSYQIQNNGI